MAPSTVTEWGIWPSAPGSSGAAEVFNDDLSFARNGPGPLLRFVEPVLFFCLKMELYDKRKEIQGKGNGKGIMGHTRVKKSSRRPRPAAEIVERHPLLCKRLQTDLQEHCSLIPSRYLIFNNMYSILFCNPSKKISPFALDTVATSSPVSFKDFTKSASSFVR